jgi:hypothetical protein
MRIVHWTITNGSGMHRVAESLALAERALGLDSYIARPDVADDFEPAASADIHVNHTHVPERFVHSGAKIVWIGHGTPEVMLHSTYESVCVQGNYGHGDAFMLAQFWMQRADAIVTFWPRHQRIWQSLCDKHTQVNLVPLGVDTRFWQPVPSLGKYAGAPSVFTAENSYEIKWPLDLFIAWPWVVQHPDLHAARLHAIYVPKDQHQVWFPLVNRNGASFSAYISPLTMTPENLRNAFASTDYYIGLVRYGDFNRICLEAKATGAQVISYRGNPYADYWVSEGDQFVIAAELMAILTGQAPRRESLPVPDIAQTAQEMKAIYERI